MTEQEKIALLEETLELDEGTLTADTVLADVEDNMKCYGIVKQNRGGIA